MLAISTKYAIKALLHLARHYPDSFVQVNALSQETDVPGPYLSKIVKTLAAKGLVETRRGILGGVKFPVNRGPISFFEICSALDDPVITQACFLSRSPCNSKTPCAMHSNWTKLKQNIIGFLEKAKVE